MENNEFNRGPSAAQQGRIAEKEFSGVERRTIYVIQEEYENLVKEIKEIDEQINRAMDLSIQADSERKGALMQAGRNKMEQLAEKREKLREIIEEAIAMGGKKENFPMIPIQNA